MLLLQPEPIKPQISSGQNRNQSLLEIHGEKRKEPSDREAVNSATEGKLHHHRQNSVAERDVKCNGNLVPCSYTSSAPEWKERQKTMQMKSQAESMSY